MSTKEWFGTQHCQQRFTTPSKWEGKNNDHYVEHSIYQGEINPKIRAKTQN